MKLATSNSRDLKIKSAIEFRSGKITPNNWGMWTTYAQSLHAKAEMVKQ